ncbi:RNA polymerase sigma factor [Planctomycetota bacterium]
MLATDAALVERALGGNPSAFEELIRRHVKLLYGQAYLWLGTREGAEDICQEALLKSYRALQDLRDPSQFRSWLLRIAERLCKDSRRKQGRSPVVADPEAAEVGFAEEGPPDQAVLAERARAIRSALAGLPEQYRLPLSLRYLEGLEHDEIAQRLALSNGALRGLLHRGLTKLRQKLQPLRRELGEEGRVLA